MDPRVIKNSLRIYGCTAEEAVAANQGRPMSAPGSMAVAYVAQKHNAARRGVAWQITFPEWSALWVESGKWNQRGRNRGCYCMARFLDVGPYAASNVCIELTHINNRDAHLVASRSIDYSAVAQLRRGTGRGWTFVKRQPLRPYQVMKGGTYVGSFATQIEAEAAYASAP